MNFQEAMAQLGRVAAPGQLAAALGIPPDTVSEYLAGSGPRRPTPPAGWRAALARLAREQGSALDAMASALEAEDTVAAPAYEILQTHVKYIIWDDQSELIKLRKIRTFAPIRELTLDRHPVIGAPNGGHEPPIRHFYSLPGTATRKHRDGEEPSFVIDLTEGEVFEAEQEYAVVFGYLLELPLRDIHPNAERDFLEIRAPLGKEQLRVEVHLPNTRRFGDEREVAVYAYFPDQQVLLEREAYSLKIDPRFKNTDGTIGGTDVLRLRMPPPDGALFIRIIWSWSERREAPSSVAPSA